MSGPAGYAVSIAVGGAVALGTVAVTALAGVLVRGGGAGSYRAALARDAALRMAGALLGVTLGIGLGPPSVGAFVISFLMVYLLGYAVLIFGFGARAARDPAHGKMGQEADGNRAR